MHSKQENNVRADFQENTIKVIDLIQNNRQDEVKMYLEGLYNEMEHLEKAIDYRNKIKDIVAVAMGIVAVNYEDAASYLEQLLSPLTTYCVVNENPLVRYYTIEGVVNLILILRENIFTKMWEFLLILLESLRDINEKVREAALSLNEVLKDIVIEFTASPKLNLSEIIAEFGRMLPSLNRTSHRELVLQWIYLFDGLPIFDLNAHFVLIYEGLIGLLYGDFEPVQEKFYSKIYVYFRNFINSEKSNKHFDDTITILKLTIDRFNSWETTMSKLYLLTLLHELIELLKDYLKYADNIQPENFKVNEQESSEMMDYSFNDNISDRTPTEDILLSREVSNFDRLSKQTSIIENERVSKISSKLLKYTQFSKKKIEEIKIDKILKKLPEVLVNVFEIIVKFSVAKESIICEAYTMFFSLFKEVISELNLLTIIKMNKLLVTKCKFLMNYKQKQTEKSVKLMIISLDCFHEFVKILNLKLKQKFSQKTRENQNVIQIDQIGEEIKINQLLEMFKGIINFILKALYGHSPSVTEKIYILLKEILEIGQGMEETVTLSLFESVKHYIRENVLEKTKVILKKMFELISPITFVRIVYFYSKKDYKPEKQANQKQTVIKMISLVTSVLIENSNRDFLTISKIIFNRVETESNWIRLWSKDPTSFIKMSIFNFKFDLARMMIEELIDNSCSSQKSEQPPTQVNKVRLSLNLKQQESKDARPKSRILNNQLIVLEDIFKLLNSHIFQKRISSVILTDDQKDRLLHLTGLVVLLRENEVEGVRFLKKIKMLPSIPKGFSKQKSQESNDSITEREIFALYQKSGMIDSNSSMIESPDPKMSFRFSHNFAKESHNRGPVTIQESQRIGTPIVSAKNFEKLRDIQDNLQFISLIFLQKYVKIFQIKANSYIQVQS